MIDIHQMMVDPKHNKTHDTSAFIYILYTLNLSAVCILQEAIKCMNVVY